jgi:hypothetical protein
MTDTLARDALEWGPSIPRKIQKHEAAPTSK